MPESSFVRRYNTTSVEPHFDALLCALISIPGRGPMVTWSLMARVEIHFMLLSLRQESLGT